MALNYVIWNVTPQMIDFGKFEIRYYSLLFALGFIMGYLILLKLFKKQNLSVEFLDKLTIYMVISTIIGARLGHCLFYEFDYYINHPLEIILPWRGKIGEDFEITGFQGLASHGAAIGIIIGILIFAWKTKTSFLWIMDMIVIVTALAGASIRTGNLMNSEVYGKPAKSNNTFIFVNDLSRVLKSNYNIIENITYDKIDNNKADSGKIVPVKINIEFERKIKDQANIAQFGDILPQVIKRYNLDNNVSLLKGDSLNYTINKNKNHLVLSAEIGGLKRYPTQIYEALSYLFIFFLLLGIFYYLEDKLKEGFIFGVFLVFLFSARFLIEYIKEYQEAFEESMSLNMGQILSLPFIAIGIVFIIWKWPKFNKHES